MEFVYSGAGCRLLLMGDTAQLPPVGEEQSPALATEALKGYGLNVIEVDLTQWYVRFSRPVFYGMPLRFGS